VTLRFDDDSKGQAYIECFNALGALVHSQMTEKTAGEWQQRIEVANWPAGLYSIRVRVDGKTFGAMLAKK
jgi:hypothetical protein